jgi:hypothetical protein
MMSASSVVRSFEKAHLPVAGLLTHNGSTDPNHLLGRPGGYTSKAAWVDRPIPKSDSAGDTRGDVDYGGSVEVFASPAGAKDRAAAITGFEKQFPELDENTTTWPWAP